MQQAKVLCAFFIKSVIIYGMLMVIWPWIGQGYAGFFRRAGNALAGLGTGGHIWYSPRSGDKQLLDTELVLRDPDARRRRSVNMSSRRLGYMPGAFMIALVLAYPLTRSRRWRALLWSITWIHVWIGLVLILYPLAYGNLQSATSGSSLPASTRALQYVLEWVLSGSSAGWMLIPLLIWTLTCFRTADWAVFSGRESHIQPNKAT